MSYIIKSSCGSHIGKVRSNNEDNFYYNSRHLTMKNTALKKPLFHQDKTEEVICFAVFDGMGGEKHGEAASFIAASEFKNAVRALDDLVIPPRQFLIDACMRINRQICMHAEAEKCGGMGSTAAILYFYLEDVYMCNIGDSRVYRLRGDSFMQISVDHNDAVYTNIISSESKKNKKAALTQFLGISSDELIIEPYVAKDICKPGDRFIICSDGLTDMLSNKDIINILNCNINDQQRCAQELINEALFNGGIDNITVILCDIYN